MRNDFIVLGGSNAYGTDLVKPKGTPGTFGEYRREHAFPSIVSRSLGFDRTIDLSYPGRSTNISTKMLAELDDVREGSFLLAVIMPPQIVDVCFEHAERSVFLGQGSRAFEAQPTTKHFLLGGEAAKERAAPLANLFDLYREHFTPDAQKALSDTAMSVITLQAIARRRGLRALFIHSSNPSHGFPRSQFDYYLDDSIHAHVDRTTFPWYMDPENTIETFMGESPSGRWFHFKEDGHAKCAARLVDVIESMMSQDEDATC